MSKLLLSMLTLCVCLHLTAQVTVRDTLNRSVVYYSAQADSQYIVQLASEPLHVRAVEKSLLRKYKSNTPTYQSLLKGRIKSKMDSIENEQQVFKKDFDKIKGRLNARRPSQTKILHEFKNALNGFAIKADATTIEQLKKLKYIKKISKDRIVKIEDDASNAVIGAPQVWNQLGATGKNVVIGILDSGIDPNHPELAGKVIGGYDFVNNDSNPMDDHGHGTHCAGIAAANGPTLKGVAPDAKLMAIKVMNANGQGNWSDIIAGINYAIDPDNNPLTHDGVDILSISIGGAGSPDDDLCQAVNNAFNNGVLCIVAAGNNGSTYCTINSPGCAQNALTVGASDKIDKIASFSSRGPILDAGFVKPDVLAPGVAIYSTLPNNQYGTQNGTSMATPHVAGAAALLKELHPDWTPSDIKASLMQTAVDISENVWTQGRGRIDVLNASGVKTTVNPGLINFGNVEDGQTTWSGSQVVNLKNLSSLSETYTLSIQGTLPSGISFSYPSTISLNGNTSGSFTFSAAMNPQQITFPEDAPPTIKGVLVLQPASSSAIKIPFVITKIKTAKLVFDRLPDLVVVHDNISNTHYYYPFGLSYDMIIDKKGDYDIIACFDNCNTYVIKEQVHLMNDTSISIMSAEATNVITFQGLDINGNKIPIADISPMKIVTKDKSLGLRLSKIWLIAATPPLEITKKFSNVSDRYKFEISPISFPSWNQGKQFYLFPYGFTSGINASSIQKNNPSDFIKINRKFPKVATNHKIYYAKDLMTLSIEGISLTDVNDSGKYFDSTFTFSEYILPYPYRDFEIYGKIMTNVRLQKKENIDFKNDSVIHQTGFEAIYDGNKLNFGYDLTNDLEIEVPNKEYTIEYALTPLQFHSNWLFFNKACLFTHPYYNLTPQRVSYKIYSADSICKSETFLNQGYNYLNQAMLDKYEFIPGKRYRVELNCVEGNIDDYKCKIQANYYNVSNTSSFPDVNSFMILSNGKITNTLNCKNENVVKIKSRDGNSLLKVFCKGINDNNWKEIITTKENNLFSGSIPHDLKDGYYSLKIEVFNSTDTLILTNEPAFKMVGGCNQGTKLIFDQIPNLVVVHDNISKSHNYYPSGLGCDLTMEKEGYHDIIACFDNYNTYVIKEHVYLKNDTSIAIKSAEATNVITFQGLDINGNKIPIAEISPIKIVTKDRSLGLRLSKAWNTSSTPPLEITKRLSSLSDKYKFEISPVSLPSWNQEKQFYFFPYGFTSGIKDSCLRKNNPSDFVKINHKFPKVVTDHKIYYAKGLMTLTIGGLRTMDENDSHKYLDSTFTFSEYILPLPYRDYEINGKIWTEVILQKGKNIDLNNDSIIHKTWFETIYDGNKLSFGYDVTNDLEIEIPNKEYTIDYSLTPINFHSNWLFFKEACLFSHPYYNLTPKAISYKISSSGSICKSGTFFNDYTHLSQTYIDRYMFAPDKRYCIELDCDEGAIDDYKCKIQAKYYIDSKSFAFPDVNSFMVLSNGKMANKLNCTDDNVVKIKSRVGNILLKLFYKEVSDNDWKEIITTSGNDVFSASIPHDLKDGYYSLKIEITNSTDTFLLCNEPAFKMEGGCNRTTAKLSALNAGLKSMTMQQNSVDLSEQNLSKSYLLQSYPNPTLGAATIGYFLADNVAEARIVLYNYMGNLVKEYPVHGPGKSSLEINIGDLPAGMYSYALFINGLRIDLKKLLLVNG